MAGVHGGNGHSDEVSDVQGGFDKVLSQNWSEDTIKVAFHIADAPAPARYTGSEVKDGEKFLNQMKEFVNRDINFTFIKTNEKCDKMIS